MAVLRSLNYSYTAIEKFQIFFSLQLARTLCIGFDDSHFLWTLVL